MFDLKGRVAIVTGGNGGIGLGMARGLAGAGASVVVVGRNAEKSDAAVHELGTLGADAFAVTTDVTDETARQAPDTGERVDVVDGEELLDAIHAEQRHLPAVHQRGHATIGCDRGRWADGVPTGRRDVHRSAPDSAGRRWPRSRM